ncbi:ABC transporter ATP-binding protein [Desulfovibrio sp. OttesenSCG-928-C14]|nr:ABC transporter ATP-binding protein [Desulfovibrio sp. OttesenSCG-928-C14]
MNTIYSLREVSKVYQGPAEELRVLNRINLEIAAGDSIAVVGSSGSGKSTLLHLLGTLDDLTDGAIIFRDTRLDKLDAEQKAAFRNKELGFVFQFHHLLAEFNTLENVAMQAIIGGRPKKDALREAAEALDLVGLAHRTGHAVTTLSGGERQRAAIARAMLNKPSVLLADEPTGNLDEKTGMQIGDLLLSLNEKLGTTLVVVTHNPDLAAKMGRILEIRDGGLHER